MYDMSLYADVVEFKSRLDNIYTLKYEYDYINKVIENRTKDKLWFLNYVLEKNIIDNDCYEKLRRIVESDYKKSKLFVIGFISKNEL